jgi:hypothetical protein
MIVNYDRTVITIVNYNRKTFIVQATEPAPKTSFLFVIHSPANKLDRLSPVSFFQPSLVFVMKVSEPA